MTWVKPEFTVIELASEVTGYRYHRQVVGAQGPLRDRLRAGSAVSADDLTATVHVRVLGAAAGGGLPQWNCRCLVCQAARRGRAMARTQSSIAVRGRVGAWVVCNASPDIHEQLEWLSADGHGLRTAPIVAIVLTDAEIDHTAGLLLLRESARPVTVYSTDGVRDALTHDYPVLRMLEQYCGVEWRPLDVGGVIDVADSSIEISAFPTGGSPPLYVRQATGVGTVGLSIRDQGSDASLCYIPAIERLDAALLTRLHDSDCVLADGTFWTEDEMVSLGLSSRGARAMGHLPLTGPGGTLAALAEVTGRTILVHLNNTNPVLIDGSPEHLLAVASGIEIGHDGMEVRL